MITVNGPWCPVCDSRNVEFRTVQEPIAYTESGPVMGEVKRGVCLDCEQGIRDFDPLASKCHDTAREAAERAEDLRLRDADEDAVAAERGEG